MRSGPLLPVVHEAGYLVICGGHAAGRAWLSWRNYWRVEDPSIKREREKLDTRRQAEHASQFKSRKGIIGRRR